MKSLKKNPSLDDLEKIIGTRDRTLFFLTWLKHGRNATKAYAELHPKASLPTCQTNGSKMLSHIPLEAIATAYGLGYEKYFEVLRDAMNATKWNDFTGEREPDYKTIKLYHDKLGKLLGIEREAVPQVNVAIQNVMEEQRKKYFVEEGEADAVS